MSFLVQILVEVVGRVLLWLLAWPFRLLARLLGLRGFWERGMARNGALFPLYVFAVLTILAGVVSAVVFVLVA